MGWIENTIWANICWLSGKGHAFVTVEELYALCRLQLLNISYTGFLSRLMAMAKEGTLYLEYERVYLSEVWAYEEAAASRLRARLSDNYMPHPAIPETVTVGDMVLTAEQREALELCLSHRISVVLGGTGTGKTSIIRAIVIYSGAERVVLCAPTGKAARNLTGRTWIRASTVHSLLGVKDGSGFLDAEPLTGVELLVVDEVSMLSLGMLAGLLSCAPPACRIVLLGDPNQLLSVDVGNVIPDLLASGMPSIRLIDNHRQSEKRAALFYNVADFDGIGCAEDLAEDGSFCKMPCEGIMPVAEMAAGLILQGEEVQVLAVTNEDVSALNSAIVPMVLRDRVSVTIGGEAFYDGERVMLTRNNSLYDYANGDTGVLRIGEGGITVELSQGRRPRWTEQDIRAGKCTLMPAYAVTIHRSQGSEYENVLIYLRGSFPNLISRNLLYTAISRARKRLVLFGDREVVDTFLRTRPPLRRSMLPYKTLVG